MRASRVSFQMQALYCFEHTGELVSLADLHQDSIKYVVSSNDAVMQLPAMTSNTLNPTRQSL